MPPSSSRGSGTATVIYDTATKKLSWNVNYGGLTGPATAAHFHGPAAPDQNAGIVVPLTGDLTSPRQGSADLTDAQAADLLGERWYFNIHTAAHPGGEIRGQVLRTGP